MGLNMILLLCLAASALTGRLLWQTSQSKNDSEPISIKFIIRINGELELVQEELIA